MSFSKKLLIFAIVILIVIVVLIEFFLHWQGYSLLGLR